MKNADCNTEIASEDTLHARCERVYQSCSFYIFLTFNFYTNLITIPMMIFVQKFNFDKTPTFSRVFHPKNQQFSREIKVEYLGYLDKK